MSNPIVSPNAESDNLKQCTRCGEYKPATLEYFWRDRGMRHELSSWCRTCQNEQTRLRNWEKSQGLRDGKPARTVEPPGMKCCSWCGEVKPATLEHFPARKNGKDGLLSLCRLCRAVRKRLWINKNLEKVRAQRRSDENRRRSRAKKAGGTHTAIDVRAQYQSQRGKCWWCGEKLGNDYEVDHRVPLARCGSNAPENIVLACRKCNRAKGDRLPHEWCGRLL